MAAAEQGLGTCWVCNFDVTLCRELFGIADPLEPVVLIPIGYPTVNEPSEKNRKPMDEVFVNL
jgi:nitroreductase